MIVAIHPSPGWIVLTGLAPLAYLNAPWVRWVEYLPFYALLGAGWLITPGLRRRVIEFAAGRGPAG